jgi:hypothetical protein
VPEYSSTIFYNPSAITCLTLLPVSTGCCPPAGQGSMAAAKPDSI